MEAQLRKNNQSPRAKLGSLRHPASEIRHGLRVAVQVTQDDGTAKRSTTAKTLKDLTTAQRPPFGGNKGYARHRFVGELRMLNVNMHVAQNIEQSGGSAIERHMTRHAEYAVNLETRKWSENAFARPKAIGLLTRPKMRGRRKIEAAAMVTLIRYSPVHMRNLWVPVFA